MMVFRVLLMLGMLLMMTVESSGSSGSSGSSSYNNYNYDRSGQSLTDLYNSRVREVEVVRRPLEGFWGKIGITHSGVRATLEDGSQWLVHKGKNYGLSGGQTVVTDAGNMGNRWRAEEPVQIGGSKTIGDLVAAGGTKYKVLLDDCNVARKAMMKP